MKHLKELSHLYTKIHITKITLGIFKGIDNCNYGKINKNQGLWFFFLLKDAGLERTDYKILYWIFQGYFQGCSNLQNVHIINQRMFSEIAK